MTKKAARRVGNPRGSGSNLRQELLAAAERLLETSGSRDAVTLRAIAREAGVAAPSIYPHFPNRDAILDAVVARTFKTLAETCRDAADATSGGVDEVEAICLAYIRFAGLHPGQYRILFERSSENIASPPHQYAEGIEAFEMLVRAIEGASPTVAAHAPATFLDAQLLFAALHGICTLEPALPGFPWLEETVLVRGLIARTLRLDPPAPAARGAISPPGPGEAQRAASA